LFLEVYDPSGRSDPDWDNLDAPVGLQYAWDPSSTYLIEPPFFSDAESGDALKRLAARMQQCFVLAAFGDSLTTDHISPGGEIPVETPAGRYLIDMGVAQRDFNSYVGRRGNHHVMSRATFANIRLHNELLPGIEGGVTSHFPDGGIMPIFDAAQRYKADGHASIVLAGKEYGTGSSRDWAAKGVALLGVCAVIAESFERIHRSNLIGMGVLPLAFDRGQGWRSLGLTGKEQFEFIGVESGVRDGRPVTVIARDSAKETRFLAFPQVLTRSERALMIQGGIPASVLRGFLC
jgi:aconitate hydratase